MIKYPFYYNFSLYVKYVVKSSTLINTLAGISNDQVNDSVIAQLAWISDAA